MKTRSLLTEKERSVLNALFETTKGSDTGREYVLDHVAEHVGISDRSLAGVVSSLEKKGVVIVWNGDCECYYYGKLTDLGMSLIGQPTETKAEPKPKAKAKTSKRTKATKQAKVAKQAEPQTETEPTETKAQTETKAEAETLKTPKHNIGDHHPNHPNWVWREYKPGRFDWRIDKSVSVTK